MSLEQTTETEAERYERVIGPRVHDLGENYEFAVDDNERAKTDNAMIDILCFVGEPYHSQYWLRYLALTGRDGDE